MWDLYQADYRVRIYMAGFFLRKLTAWEEGQVSNSMVENTLLQCAICFEVGFGVARDPKRSQELLKRCRDDNRMNFLRELESAKRDEYDWTIFRFDERSNYQKMYLDPTGDNTPRQNLFMPISNMRIYKSSSESIGRKSQILRSGLRLIIGSSLN